MSDSGYIGPQNIFLLVSRPLCFFLLKLLRFNLVGFTELFISYWYHSLQFKVFVLLVQELTSGLDYLVVVVVQEQRECLLIFKRSPKLLYNIIDFSLKTSPRSRIKLRIGQKCNLLEEK